MTIYITNYCILRNEGLMLPEQDRPLAPGNTPFPEGLAEALGIDYPRIFKMDKQAASGVLASEALLKNHPLQAAPESVAVVLSNANASLEADTKFQATIDAMASPALFVCTLPNIVAGEICIRHGFKGENAFFVSSQFDAAWMKDYVEQVFRLGSAEACVAGWVDVVGGHTDVFLYLVEKQKRGIGLPHRVEEINRIYNNNIWNS